MASWIPLQAAARLFGKTEDEIMDALAEHGLSVVELRARTMVCREELERLWPRGGTGEPDR